MSKWLEWTGVALVLLCLMVALLALWHMGAARAGL